MIDLLIKDGIAQRLEDAVKIATKMTDGIVIVAIVDGEETMYSERLACVNCGISIPQLEPRSFSFNSAFGACKKCNGIGSKPEIDPLRLILDDTILISKITFFNDAFIDPYLRGILLAVARHFEISPETEFGKLPQKAQNAFLYGLQREIADGP